MVSDEWGSEWALLIVHSIHDRHLSSLDFIHSTVLCIHINFTLIQINILWMSQSAKHFLPLKDLFCASFTGNLWVFSSKTWRTFVFRSDDKLLEIGQGPTDTTDTIILRWDVWGCTRGMVICDVPATWIGKKCSTFLVASPSEGWHNFCLVSNFFLKCIIRVLIRFIMGIFFLMESQPIWIVDIPSKIKLCVVKFDHAIKKKQPRPFPT